jgi:hypothetical protein
LHKRFSASIGIGLDTLEVLIPIEGLIKILPEFVEDGNLFSKHTLTAHLLKDKTIYLQIGFNPSQESELVLLDKLTSSIIKRGGTLRTSNRASLDAISPFLAKRIVGQGSLSLQ